MSPMSIEFAPTSVPPQTESISPTSVTDVKKSITPQKKKTSPKKGDSTPRVSKKKGCVFLFWVTMATKMRIQNSHDVCPHIIAGWMGNTCPER